MVTIDSTGLGELKRVKIKGPAVDSLDCRKEDNNHEKMTTEQLRNNLKSVKETMLAELKNIASFSIR